MNSLRNRLQQGEQLLGTMLTLPSPEIAELLALTGFDWLFIDGEHGPFGIKEINSVLQAVGEKSACMVRVPSIEETPIKQALDAGASGIIVPQVNSAEAAKNVVEFCRYPPSGSRGIGVARAHGYGIGFQDYIQTANENLTIVVQAEHKLAVENIEEIVKVPGIDCILIGPNDLSASYNKLGQFEDPEIVEAIRHVEVTCQAAGIPLGIFGMDSKSVEPHMARGYQLIVAGIDVAMLGGTAKRLLQEMQTGKA